MLRGLKDVLCGAMFNKPTDPVNGPEYCDMISNTAGLCKIVGDDYHGIRAT
jgi:hypothetical protein